MPSRQPKFCLHKDLRSCKHLLVSFGALLVNFRHLLVSLADLFVNFDALLVSSY
ncbi:hypothetical protein [Peribacillus sp. NJ4]|uniref:hypothetical protein n=1 Tax=Peribacillus sp. NJ4 TaxID=3055862 RepID=UPI0025A197D7|nr:hypothetical protein [Peribacillus sp. NJ4]